MINSQESSKKLSDLRNSNQRKTNDFNSNFLSPTNKKYNTPIFNLNQSSNENSAKKTLLNASPNINSNQNLQFLQKSPHSYSNNQLNSDNVIDINIEEEEEEINDANDIGSGINNNFEFGDEFQNENSDSL